tara:strand:- start:38 stop:502 length:465 start_codon:yes stop_codon:yes gene_type:complete
MKNIILMIILIIFSFNAKTLADIIKIIDGDTIIINKEKIRFSGIDTPELKQTCQKNNKIYYCGIKAKRILIRKIGKNVPKCIKEGKDIYKRTLAECFVNGKSLSTFLVRNGYAFAYRKYSKKFIKDEEFAKSNNLGMWSMKFQYPWEYRKSTNY